MSNIDIKFELDAEHDEDVAETPTGECTETTPFVPANCVTGKCYQDGNDLVFELSPDAVRQLFGF